MDAERLPARPSLDSLQPRDQSLVCKKSMIFLFKFLSEDSKLLFLWSHLPDKSLQPALVEKTTAREQQNTHSPACSVPRPCWRGTGPSCGHLSSKRGTMSARLLRTAIEAACAVTTVHRGVLANSPQLWKRKRKRNFWFAVIVKSYV